MLLSTFRRVLSQLMRPLLQCGTRRVTALTVIDLLVILRAEQPQTISVAASNCTPCAASRHLQHSTACKNGLRNISFYEFSDNQSDLLGSCSEMHCFTGIKVTYWRQLMKL